jgi:ribose-phosphate pyrophosphokinase
VAATNMLINKGARSVRSLATHGVLSGPALERINNSILEEVVLTNTICQQGKESSKINIVSIAPIVGEAIKRIYENSSVSSLFV